MASVPRTPAAAAAAVPAAAWMNSRRLKYSFRSVISELRMSGGLLDQHTYLLYERDPKMDGLAELARWRFDASAS